MHIDWISNLISFVIGVGASYLADSLFKKFARRRKGQYFTVTYESGIMHFEGQTPKDVSIDEIAKQLFEMKQGENSTN
jgi:hypothetical protein